MKIARIGYRLSLGVLLLLPAGAVYAQSSTPAAQSSSQPATDPLAAAAKRTRDDKKDSAKTARVWDNDTIPKAGDQISVVGSNATAATGDSTPAAPAAPSAQAVAATDAQNEAQLSSAKEKLASLKVDLDLLQRTFSLDSQMYYSKPDYSTDRDGARKLKDEQTQIADKQQAIADMEKQIADLEAKSKTAPANPPPAQPNSN